MNNKYSQEIKNKATLLYSEGLSLRKVGQELNIPVSTVTEWIRQEGIMRKIKPQADLNKMNQAKDLYNQGFNTNEIAKKLNTNSGSVLKWLKSLNVEIRHRGPKSKIKNEDFFDIINTEEKAYFLGWIMADGCISIENGQYSLKLHISYNDKELIDNFLKVIESTNKTKYKPENGNGSYYVSLTSVHMVKSLIKLGVKPQKSGHEIIPDIPENLISHFIRGYFDGDGITDVKQHRSGFISSYEVIDQIDSKLNINKKNLIQKHSKSVIDVYYILYGKNDSKKLFDYMYKNATIYLKRKYDRMNIICNNTEVN